MYIKYQLVIINIDMQCYMGNVRLWNFKCAGVFQ
jgi:hypothetical protein